MRAGVEEPAVQPPLVGRLRPWHWVAVDTVVAAALAFVTASEALVMPLYGPVPGPGLPAAARIAVSLLVTAPVAVRRRWPLPVFGLVLAASAAAMLIGIMKDPFVALALAAYPVGLRLPRRPAVTALVVAEAVVAVSVTASPAAAYWRIGADNVFGHLVMSAVVVLGAWTIGVAARGQRAYAAGLRDQATRRAVTEERLRIARELHDVVSHSMSVIAVRAAVAGYVAATPESPAVAALRDIELVSREALLELRHLLGVLRTDGQPDGPDGTELAPTPSLADLDRLVADTARAGADVHLRTSGDVRPLPPGVELSAYRIVQEALTNLVRHARPARGTVALGFRPDRVTIEVTDDGGLDGADPPDRTGGHGLIGMRERVSLYGGTFSAGPLPGHGFRVAATIPLPPVPR